MTTYRLDATTEKTPSVCGQIGGKPQLPQPGDWSRCRLCDEEMIAFLDLVLPANDSTTFVPSSRLQVFACREHDDVAGTIYSDYTAFVNGGRQHRLPDEY